MFTEVYTPLYSRRKMTQTPGEPPTFPLECWHTVPHLNMRAALLIPAYYVRKNYSQTVGVIDPASAFRHDLCWQFVAKYHDGYLSKTILSCQRCTNCCMQCMWHRTWSAWDQFTLLQIALSLCPRTVLLRRRNTFIIILMPSVCHPI